MNAGLRLGVLGAALLASTAFAQKPATPGLRSFDTASVQLDLYKPAQLALLDDHVVAANTAERLARAAGLAARRVDHLGAAADTGPGGDEKEEQTLGREVAGRALGNMRLVNDAAIQIYVNRVGRWLASQSERPSLPWRFGVVEAVSLNAYAAPGGYIFVTSGLYDSLENEAQLAAVLAHAMSSVVGRQHVRLMQRSAALSAVTGAAQQALTSRSGLGVNVLTTTSAIMTRGIQRDAVFEADALAVVLAARAGYEASAILEVLQRLPVRAVDAGAEGNPAALMATHPEPKERAQRLEDKLAALPSGKKPPLYPVTPM